MTTKVEIKGKVNFDFKPAESNMAEEEPKYDDTDAGFVPDRGTAQVEIFSPHTGELQKIVIIKDFVHRAEVVVGNRTRTKRREGKPTQVEFRGVHQRISIANMRRRIFAGDAIVLVTHPAPTSRAPRQQNSRR